MKPSHRFSVEALRRFAATTDRGLALAIGVHPAQIWIWKDLGGIPLYRADRIAIKTFGCHPSAIWPEWFDIEVAA